MTDDTAGRYSHLLRGGAIMVGVVAIYLLASDPGPLFLGLLVAAFLVGVIVALGVPGRLSARTTLQLYRAAPLLFGVAASVFGAYSAVTTELPILSAVVVVWGGLALAVSWFAPWEEVRAHLEAYEGSQSDHRYPIPKRRFEQLRFGSFGLLVATFAVVGARLLVRLDVGTAALLAGIAVAGLAHAGSSPYSGPADRVVRFRQARWIAFAVGAATSSLHSVLTVGLEPLGAALGASALAAAYWAGVYQSWDEVRAAIERAQAGNLDE